MQLRDYHLTYCTNIHPAETWEDTEASLHQYIPQVKKVLSPDQPLGIGLRLSHIASETLIQPEALAKFKSWLASQNAYVFTMNGFPYGNFHREVVKGDVHTPDWTTHERLDYTIRMFDILSALLPEGMEGGISTSPLSYKLWHKQEDRDEVMRRSTMQVIAVAEHLYHIRQQTGQWLHLDIEPEPDGMLENTQEMIDFYRHWLLPLGTEYLQERTGLDQEAAESCLKDHIQLCYDVCHFAIVYEEPEDVFKAMEAAGIKIGKVQISAALKAHLKDMKREQVSHIFAPFVESTYLHQVVQRNTDDSFQHFDDLPAALAQPDFDNAAEWRTHFHVPVFLDQYGSLKATQDDILKVLYYLKDHPITHHLEVETYTWEVLPSDIQLPLADSIIRELQWVKQNLQ